MIGFLKRPKCGGCGTRFKKNENGSEIQLETLDGLHTMKFCDRCSLIIEEMRTASLGGKKNDDESV